MRKKVVIIGAGLGGISAGISLASYGYRVSIFEKNRQPGGKLNLDAGNGFLFDLGPSILTLPHVFRALFARAHCNIDDYISLVPLEHHWRAFFEDGITIDLVADRDRQKQILDAHHPDAASEFDRFLDYSQKQYELVREPYIFGGADTFGQVMRAMPMRALVELDMMRSMNQAVHGFFSSRHLREIFSFFSKYVGSSAEKAPGFMNLLPWVQYNDGLWHIKGGMYGLADGLAKAFAHVGGTLCCNAEVKEIEHAGEAVRGVRLHDGTFVQADYVVSNMEVIPAYERCIKNEHLCKTVRHRFEPSCSGLAIHLGVKGIYSHLAHHNFFFSRDQHRHYHDVFERMVLPRDPTLYVVAPVRTDSSLAPDGYDIIKILPHIPHLNERHVYGPHEYAGFRERVLLKCERMGLKDLRKNIVAERTLTPIDIREMYFSNQGAIYGVVSDRFKNFSLKMSKRDRNFRNLFFAGGSVNPGGGMPMVALSGMQTAELIRRDTGGD